MKLLLLGILILSTNCFANNVVDYLEGENGQIGFIFDADLISERSVGPSFRMIDTAGSSYWLRAVCTDHFVENCQSFRFISSYQSRLYPDMFQI